jgi:hypothetical protein
MEQEKQFQSVKHTKKVFSRNLVNLFLQLKNQTP